MPKTKKGQKKNDKTIMKENGNVANPVKKIKRSSGSKERVEAVLEKEHNTPSKKRHKLPEHVIPLEYPFFIRAYSAGFALCEAKKPVDGKPTYTSLCYASRLEQMFSIVVNYMIKVPLDVQELSEKLDHIYEMIKARVENKKASELFVEYKNSEDFLEDFK